MKMLQDFNYAWRLLRKTPGFSSICVVVVAIGISISVITFTLVYQFRYKTPDFPKGDQVVVIEVFDKETHREINGARFNSYAAKQIQENAGEFEELGAFNSVEAIFSEGETAQQYNAVFTTPNLIALTQTRPLLGRVLHPSDTEAAAEPVVVISENIWKNYYNENPDIIGHSSRINGKTYSIVGVMPSEFSFPNAFQQVWLPLNINQFESQEQRGSNSLVGVLNSSYSKLQATQSVNNIISRLHTEYPNGDYEFNVEVRNYVHMMSQGAGEFGDLLLAIAVVILILCSVNLTTLLIVRATARQQELAIRKAIGAKSWQIVTQVLIESFIICAVGVAIAIGLSSLALDVLRNMFLNSANESIDQIFKGLSINSTIMVFALFATLAIWLLAGGATAYRIVKKDINTILDGSTKGSTDRSSMATTKVVIGTEIILSVFLVSLCGVFASAINNLYKAEYGIATENRYVGGYSLNTADFVLAKDRTNFSEKFINELRQHPQIVDAAITTRLPSTSGNVTPYSLLDRDLKTSQEYPRQSVIWVSDSYFGLMEVDIKAGRNFDSSDQANSDSSVIVTEEFANSMWPGVSALGKQIELDPENEAEILTVIGVIEHIVQSRPDSRFAARPSFYRPLSQRSPTDFRFVVQTRLPIANIKLNQLVGLSAAKINRNIPISNIVSLDRFFETELNVLGPVGKLFVAIAFTTLILAVLGIFGVVYRSVLSRKMEIGVRRALGSSNTKIIVIFLKQGLIYIALGAVIGGTLTALCSQLLTNTFINIFSYLPSALIFTLIIVGSLVLLASYIPARKVIAMEPGDALKYD